jgi:uncharacterized iron-regulated membrane protein
VCGTALCGLHRLLHFRLVTTSLYDAIPRAFNLVVGSAARQLAAKVERPGRSTALTRPTLCYSLSLVDGNDQPTAWQCWVRKPQRIWLRRALFQAHLWSGISVGLYVFTISITGSVLVFWNELYRAATPQPIISKSSRPRLTGEQLAAAAQHLYPGYRVVKISRAQNLDQEVDISLQRGHQLKHRRFDPRNGSDLGDAVSTGMRLVSFVLDLHDNLLAGETGRMVNAVGAFAVLALAVSGIVIWWPGNMTWRRSLTLPRGVGWRRLTWHLHSMIGFWSFGFVLVFGLSGIYLCFPDWFQNLADRLEPVTVANGKVPMADQVIYWLAYLHFGRIGGIGIPCSGPGLCDMLTKATWAVFGLAPAVMFVTGAIMWWNRVLRPRMTAARRAVLSRSVNA